MTNTLPSLVMKCRQHMIDSAGGALYLYKDYLEEAKQIQGDINTAKTAISLFAGRPEEKDALLRLEYAEKEAFEFRAMIYKIYNKL